MKQKIENNPKNPAVSRRFRDEKGNHRVLGEDEANFQRLTGALQAVRGKTNSWDTDYTAERYVAATDHMIGLLSGDIQERAITDPDNPELFQEKPDTVIWLDKSARPVSWFVDAFWEQLADSDVEKPTDEFLNIDRVNWFVKQGHSLVDAERRLGPNDFDIDKVNDNEIASLRALFVIGDLTEENWQNEVWQLPTRLDGQNILIIDEVKNKGGTLSIATQLIKRAIPEATVSGDYFWKTGTYSLGKSSAERTDQQMESAPIWYDKNSQYGRGVGEVSIDYWKHLYETEPTQANLKSMIGASALSAPHYDPADYRIVEDPLALKLAQDIAYLTYAVADQKVLRTPSKERPLEQIKKIIEEQGFTTIDQYRNYREARSRNPRENSN